MSIPPRRTTVRSLVLENRKITEERNEMLKILEEFSREFKVKSKRSLNKLLDEKQSETDFNKAANLKNQYQCLVLNLNSGTFEEETLNFYKILNWEGKPSTLFPKFIKPPETTQSIRQTFNDFNDLLKDDQVGNDYIPTILADTSTICQLKSSKNPRIEAIRQNKRKLQESHQHICFYCCKKIERKDDMYIDSQCDHIFPIIQALLSLKRNSNLLFNYHSVHRQCNSAASKKDILEIWNLIGTSFFTDKIKGEFPDFSNIPIKLNDGTVLQARINSSILKDREDIRIAICRGYLSQLLNKLTIVDMNTQKIRKSLLNKVLKTFELYKTNVKELLSDELSTAIKILGTMKRPEEKELVTTKLKVKGITKSEKLTSLLRFGTNSKIKLINITKLDNHKNKFEAIFEVNGNEKKEKFGASGYSDYTIHKNIDRRNSYIARHWSDLETNDPTRAGYLSMYILWNYPNLQRSINDYKNRLEEYNKTGKFPKSINNYNKFGSNNFGSQNNFGSKNNFETIKIELDKNIPKNVNYPEVYQKIKNKIRQSVKDQNRRWGAYDSGILVKTYVEEIEKTGKVPYSGEKKESNLSRWYKEKWIDACSWPTVKSCGRNDMNSLINYCRPSVRVNPDTPKTVQELSPEEIIKRCSQKKANPMKIIK